MTRRAYPESLRAEAVRLYQLGNSSRDVADILNVGVSFVLAAVREAGAVRRPGRSLVGKVER
jgi:transposase-like protein